jgi:hypothetical protein
MAGMWAHLAVRQGEICGNWAMVGSKARQAGGFYRLMTKEGGEPGDFSNLVRAQSEKGWFPIFFILMHSHFKFESH